MTQGYFEANDEQQAEREAILNSPEFHAEPTAREKSNARLAALRMPHHTPAGYRMKGGRRGRELEATPATPAKTGSMNRLNPSRFGCLDCAELRMHAH